MTGYIGKPVFSAHSDSGCCCCCGETAQIKSAVELILRGNAEFVKRNGPEHFAPFISGQHPKATVISCSDSRVQMLALDSSPDNNLFVVRNIGNQIATAEGSVEYGVHHLHTPLLLIVGHVRCGAVTAASGDYSKESAAIRRELDTLKVIKGGDIIEGAKLNVHHQVSVALSKFGHEVEAGKLAVIGCLYDFANDLGLGHGKLTFINVNGHTEPEKMNAILGLE